MERYNPQLGVLRCETFSDYYPRLNQLLLSQPQQESRGGRVQEVLDFKTTLTNPYNRCVGGCKRNINIFFLLAEAMWIFRGKKDTHFLCIFNKKMSDFSDNGRDFHAPYGFRLRHYGLRSEDDHYINDSHQGIDQVANAMEIFSHDVNTRQVVMSIWNPELDLGCKTKDIPCNDLIMLKIRDGKLITTIQNRSNDLHWGLPTNIFQFSFLTEIMSNCLGIELGTQTHNSQSLHIYDWNNISEIMNNEYLEYLSLEREKHISSMYMDAGAFSKKMDFNFKFSLFNNRLKEVDRQLDVIISNITNLNLGLSENQEEIATLKEFSNYLYLSYQLLKIYTLYKKNIKDKDEKAKEHIKHYCIEGISSIEQKNNIEGWDITMLAKNFFYNRSKEFKDSKLGNL